MGCLGQQLLWRDYQLHRLLQREGQIDRGAGEDVLVAQHPTGVDADMQHEPGLDHNVVRLAVAGAACTCFEMDTLARDSDKPADKDSVGFTVVGSAGSSSVSVFTAAPARNFQVRVRSLWRPVCFS